MIIFWSNSYYDQIACQLDILSMNIINVINDPDGAWNHSCHQHFSIINEEMMIIDNLNDTHWSDNVNGDCNIK